MRIYTLLLFSLLTLAGRAVEVTFRVNMSGQTVSPNGVHVAGNFQGWSPDGTELTPEGNGLYSATVDVAPGSIQFKYLNGDAWGTDETVPGSCGVPNGTGGFNRSAVVPSDSPLVLDVVCFGSCTNCPSGPATVNVTFRVDMSNEVVSAQGVHLVGSFQEWDPDATPMADQGNGVYAVTLPLEGPGTYQYAFVNGNTFDGRENVPMICGLPNGFPNQYNREIELIGNSDAVLDIVCFSGCDDCPIIVEPTLVNVTFKVDVSNQDVHASGVHIAGTFQNWVPGNTPMTDDGNGIWSYTTQLEAGTNIRWKFINGNAWGMDEAVPSACAQNGDRFMVVPDTDVELDTVCFGACAGCGQAGQTVMVLFQVNMANEAVSANGVHLAGNFQGWNPNGTVMTDIGGGLFEILHQVPANSTIEFRFVNGSTWNEAESAPEACGVPNGFGQFNRQLEVGSTNTVFGPVCFGECEDCVPQVPLLLTFRVDLSNENVSSEGVYLAGDFNDWDPAATQMSEYEPGKFQGVALVNSGEVVRYKFLNGPDFAGSESVPSSCGVSDGFGGFNRSHTMGTSSETLPLVCFSGCEACIPSTDVSVTFRVDMSQETVSPNGVHIAGSFNDFSPSASEMTLFAPGVYTFTAEVAPNTQVFYKFINGDDWPGVETVPFACGFDDGFGGFNRSITVGSSDLVVNEVCFSDCSDCTVGVEEGGESPLFVYPNPASDWIVIQPGNAPAGTVRFHDARGRLMALVPLQTTAIHRLDVSGWPAGVYHYQAEGSPYAGRIVIR